MTDGVYRETRAPADLAGYVLCTWYRRVGEDEVEAARGVVRVVVVAVDLADVADVAFEAMHGEVQAAEASGFVGLLDAVDAEFL